MRSIVVLSGLAALVAAVSATHLWAAPVASVANIAPPVTAFLPQPPTVAPRQIVLFGRVKSLARVRGRYLMRVDPAEFLSGETANCVAANKVIPPCEPIPNDHLILDEGHRLLTYRVPAAARVTVVTNPGPSGIQATPISIAELAQIVKGRNPNKRPLFEPKNGFWIRVAGDRALALDQQYTP